MLPERPTFPLYRALYTLVERHREALFNDDRELAASYAREILELAALVFRASVAEVEG